VLAHLEPLARLVRHSPGLEQGSPRSVQQALRLEPLSREPVLQVPFA
jgi:hypothetical protein